MSEVPVEETGGFRAKALFRALPPGSQPPVDFRGGVCLSNQPCGEGRDTGHLCDLSGILITCLSVLQVRVKNKRKTLGWVLLQSFHPLGDS